MDPDTGVGWCNFCDEDEYGGYYDDFTPYSYGLKSITCKFCGCSGLEWEKTKDGWRLFEGFKQHICSDRAKDLPTRIKAALEKKRTSIDKKAKD